jgi:hypothetical protein
MNFSDPSPLFPSCAGIVIRNTIMPWMKPPHEASKILNISFLIKFVFKNLTCIFNYLMNNISLAFCKITIVNFDKIFN